MNVEKIYLKALEQYNAKNFDAALKTIDKIKLRAPKFKKAYDLEAQLWKKLNQPVKQYYALKKILPLMNLSSAEEKEFNVYILTRLGDVSSELSLTQEDMVFYSTALELGTSEKTALEAMSNILFSANAVETFSAENFLALYEKSKKLYDVSYPFRKQFYNHEKIRVGYLSNDFNGHVVMTWSWALFHHFDKEHFKIYCYSNNKKSDVLTNHLRFNVNEWRDIFDLTDEEVAKVIRDDEIDILFDLNGHTSGSRLRIAAHRPASVQISGIGYMNSTGLDAMDYFLSDVYCAGDSEKYFTEKLIILPHSHICYEPMNEVAHALEPPCLKKGFITFSSFNNFSKVTDSMLTTWKKILDTVPNSRLILKHTIFNTNDGKNFIGKRLKSFGFNLKRIEMRPYSPDYLEQYADVDIALDTFPYTGGVTTCDALYMGVPVISLYGDRHGTRFGLSILSNVGLNELALDSYDEYINRAVALAGDWELLTILRRNLRTMMKKSPLMDAEGYVREVEKAFAKILSDEREKFSSK